MKSIILTILILFAHTAFSQVTLNEARKMYFGMSADECNSLKLSTSFDKSPPKDAVLTAYYGAATAASPACISNPARKISNFRKGKQLLESAVQTSPNNLEIRFLRFATQSKAPSFLGYNSSLNDDKKFILSNLSTFGKIKGNEQLSRQITDFMMKSGELTANEITGIKPLMN
jgi:hypothetical protein